MKSNKKYLTIVMLIVLAGLFLCLTGCKKSGTKSAQAADSVQLCLHCGQIKGDAQCCKPDQAKCSGCGLVKGSPGCCNIPEGASEAAICTKCGQIKGDALCCKPDQTKCSGCGLVKGSPGCCKLPKI